jgi:transposase
MAAPRVNQVRCSIRRVSWSLAAAACPQCEEPARRVWEASRTAIDVDLDHPVLLLVTVSVHRCQSCGRHFRVQPPFLRPDATYTNRVMEKAVASVVEDGMALW